MPPDKYLDAHPLTEHLKGLYPLDFGWIAAVRIKPLAGVDPSAWPLITNGGLRDVPRDLVRAYALLRWIVLESHPDTAELESADRIINAAELCLLADVGLKHVQAGKKGRAVQKQAASNNHQRVLAIYNRLNSERPRSSKNDLVSRTASEAACSKATVWRALRSKKSTVTGPD